MDMDSNMQATRARLQTTWPCNLIEVYASSLAWYLFSCD